MNNIEAFERAASVLVGGVGFGDLQRLIPR